MVSLKEGDKRVLIMFSPEDIVDLFAEAHRHALAMINDPGYISEGIIIPNSDLRFVRTEPTWLNAPSIEEVQMIRFIDVGSEL